MCNYDDADVFGVGFLIVQRIRRPIRHDKCNCNPVHSDSTAKYALSFVTFVYCRIVLVPYKHTHRQTHTLVQGTHTRFQSKTQKARIHTNKRLCVIFITYSLHNYSLRKINKKHTHKKDLKQTQNIPDVCSVCFLVVQRIRKPM